MKKPVAISAQDKCFSVFGYLILHIPMTIIISFSKIVFSLNVVFLPIINSFPFFFFFSLFSVFKRAVILVYKENYKLKKKMVSLVSVEMVNI